MASLGRFEFTVLDTAGNAVSGASVEMRRQGASCVGSQSGSPLTVDHVGMITAADVIALNTGTTTVNVSAVTATTVTCGAGFTVVDDDRLTIVSALPTIYEDNQGNTSTSNPMTTDANGFVSCYITGGTYDVKISGSGVTTRLIQDVAIVGGETNSSTVYDGGSAVAWVLDTYRTLSTTAKLLSVRNATAEKFSVNQAGNVAAAGTLAVTGASTLTGAVTAGAGAAVTGAISATTTITAGTGITSTTGNIKATAGDANIRRVTASQATSLTTSDFAISASWGDTAVKSINGNARDMCGNLRVQCNGAGIGANPTITITYKDGTWNGGTFPNAVCSREDSNAPVKGAAGASNDFYISSVGTGSLIIGFSGTPQAGNTYGVNYLVIG